MVFKRILVKFGNKALNVMVTLPAEVRIEICSHLVRAHVLDCLVQLLEAVGYGALQLDCDNHLGQFGPGFRLVVLR